MSKLKFWHLVFVLCAFSNAYALNLDKPKAYLLKGDYKGAISEGEKLIAQDSHSDELYYILGISYLRDGNYLRASDIFEIILKEFKDSSFKDDSLLGLGDSYLLRGDFQKAQGYYEELIKTNPRTRLLAQAYFRLSQAGFKKGDTGEGKEYLNKLKRDFPLSPELRMEIDLPIFQDGASEVYYTVQVGSFSKSTNAKNLAQALAKKGYAAYIQEVNSQEGTSYKVRVGKPRSLQEAKDLEKKLAQEGYPTKIFP